MRRVPSTPSRLGSFTPDARAGCRWTRRVGTTQSAGTLTQPPTCFSSSTIGPQHVFHRDRHTRRQPFPRRQSRFVRQIANRSHRRRRPTNRRQRAPVRQSADRAKRQRRPPRQIRSASARSFAAIEVMARSDSHEPVQLAPLSRLRRDKPSVGGVRRIARRWESARRFDGRQSLGD